MKSKILCLVLVFLISPMLYLNSVSAANSVAGQACDFNGDGMDDHAFAAAYENIGAIIDAGAVNVIYGSNSGLNAIGDQIWHQNSPGVNGGAEANDLFGSSLSCGDFNNDGFSDLAIGVPNENIGAIANAGAVNVLYGSNSGLSATGDQVWHQDSPGILGGAEAFDHFGRSLVSGDFDNDGYADLAVGVPGEGINTIGSAGAVNVLYGSSSGLNATGDQVWHQNSPGIAGGAEANDLFGSSLSFGDFNDDGYADLAIGVPGEGIGTIERAGAVNVLYGSNSGLNAIGDQVWHQNSPGVAGGAEAIDEFGRSLSSGDFDNDGYADLAIGVPGEDIGTIRRVGVVNVLYGSSSGLSTNGDQIWHQDSPGIAGGAEALDNFGSSLTSGDFDNDSFTDLAIGVPGEDIGTIANAGAVNVIFGSNNGLTAGGDKVWYQSLPGIIGSSEANDRFGASLASGDFNGDGNYDLSIGVPGEDIGSIFDGCLTNVIYGSPSGLSDIGDQIWHQDSPGIVGGAEDFDCSPPPVP